jgi:ferritin
MKAKIQDAINEQIQAEFDSAYIYLAMSARFESMGLRGFAQWMRVQWEEETIHAMKLFDFVHQRNGEVTLLALPQPEVTFETALEAFEVVLKHEQLVTQLINDLYALAIAEHDYPLQTLLQWFIDEQVEEEDQAREIIDHLRLVGSAGQGLFLLDRDMGARQAAEGGEDA